MNHNSRQNNDHPVDRHQQAWDLKVVTRIESCVYSFNPETKQQSLQWKNSVYVQRRFVRSGMQPSSCWCFSLILRGCTCEFVSQTQMPGNNSLRVNIWPKLWCTGNWAVHCDETPGWSALESVSFFPATSRPHPSYSLDSLQFFSVPQMNYGHILNHGPKTKSQMHTCQ